MKIKSIVLLIYIIILGIYIYVLNLNPLISVRNVDISDIVVDQSALNGYQAAFDISNTQMELLKNKMRAKQITILLSVRNLSICHIYDLGLRYADLSTKPSGIIGNKIDLHSVSAIDAAPFSKEKLEFRILMDSDLTTSQIYEILSNVAFQLTKNNGKIEKIKSIGKLIRLNISSR